MCKKPLKNVQEPTEKNCCETFFIGLKSNLPHKTGFPHRIITGLLVWQNICWHFGLESLCFQYNPHKFCHNIVAMFVFTLLILLDRLYFSCWFHICHVNNIVSQSTWKLPLFCIEQKLNKNTIRNEYTYILL